MKRVIQFVVSALAIGVAVVLLWPHVDRDESRVALNLTGLGLLLAWYSILDLREQRHEQYWPHTFDRLVRVTFTAITLVFVIDLTTRPPPIPIKGPPPPPPPVAKTLEVFSDEVNALSRDASRWTQTEVEKLVARHFNNVKFKDGSIYLSTENGHPFWLRSNSGRVEVGIK